MIKQINAMTKG